MDRDESRRSIRALNDATFIVRRTLHARAVDAWIANSRYVAGRHASVGIQAAVLPCFVEPPAGDRLPFADRSGALFVGRLDADKGVRDVLRIAELLPSMDVTLAGRGPLEGEVAEAAHGSPNLTFAGGLDRAEVIRLLSRARVCLMPSRWQEPGGIAALEAMSVGTPVIAYASGGLAEYVGDAGGGRVIEPDVMALARECEALEGDGSAWEELSASGAAGVAADNSLEAYVRACEAIYAKLVN